MERVDGYLNLLLRVLSNQFVRLANKDFSINSGLAHIRKSALHNGLQLATEFIGFFFCKDNVLFAKLPHEFNPRLFIILPIWPISFRNCSSDALRNAFLISAGKLFHLLAFIET